MAEAKKAGRDFEWKYSYKIIINNKFLIFSQIIIIIKIFLILNKNLLTFRINLPTIKKFFSLNFIFNSN